jgi:hypothetical protein
LQRFRERDGRRLARGLRGSAPDAHDGEDAGAPIPEVTGPDDTTYRHRLYSVPFAFTIGLPLPLS